MYQPNRRCFQNTASTWCLPSWVFAPMRPCHPPTRWSVCSVWWLPPSYLRSCSSCPGACSGAPTSTSPRSASNLEFYRQTNMSLKKGLLVFSKHTFFKHDIFNKNHDKHKKRFTGWFEKINYYNIITIIHLSSFLVTFDFHSVPLAHLISFRLQRLHCRVQSSANLVNSSN